MQLIKKDIIKSLLLFSLGNALINLVIWNTFLFVSIVFIYTSYANSFPHYINIMAFLFFKVFLNYFVLRYSNFIDIVSSKKMLLGIAFFFDICFLLIADFIIFNRTGDLNFKIGLFIFSFFASNLFSISLLSFIRKLKSVTFSKIQKSLLLILFKILSLIVVFCIIFFLCFYVSFEGRVEDSGNYQLAAFAFVSLVLYPLVIQNYLYFRICKYIHLIKNINYKKVLLITSVEFLIFYVIFLLFLFILYLKNNLY